MPNAFYSHYPCLYHSYTQTDTHMHNVHHTRKYCLLFSVSPMAHIFKKKKKICHLFIIKHHSFIIKQLWSIYRWVHQFHKWKTLMHGKMQCLRKVVYFWYTYQYILFINLSWQNTWGFCYSYIYKQFLHWPMHHHKVHIFTNGSLSLWEGLKQMSEIKLKK